MKPLPVGVNYYISPHVFMCTDVIRMRTDFIWVIAFYEVINFSIY